MATAFLAMLLLFVGLILIIADIPENLQLDKNHDGQPDGFSGAD